MSITLTNSADTGECTASSNLTISAALVDTLCSAKAGEASNDAVRIALAEAAEEDGPVLSVETSTAVVSARKVSSLADATLQTDGAAVAMPASLEGGGTIVMVKYNEPPEFTQGAEQELLDEGRRAQRRPQLGQQPAQAHLVDA